MQDGETVENWTFVENMEKSKEQSGKWFSYRLYIFTKNSFLSRFEFNSNVFFFSRYDFWLFFGNFVYFCQRESEGLPSWWTKLLLSKCYQSWECNIYDSFLQNGRKWKLYHTSSLVFFISPLVDTQFKRKRFIKQIFV